MSLTKEAIQYLQELGSAGSLDTADGNPVALPDRLVVHSLEQMNRHRYRERFTFNTSSIDAFIDYCNKTAKAYSYASTVTSVDPERCEGNAIFNLLQEGEPGHCDNTAHCRLKPLPIYKYLMSIGDAPQGVSSLSQREVLDVIRDWHEFMPDATALVQGFTKLTIEGMSKRSSEERDFGRERSALEKIDLKSDGGDVPSDINVKLIPYEGFGERNVQIGVSALLDSDREKITIRLRVRGWESLKLSIAEEFAGKLTEGLDVKPLIGTFQPA